MCRSIVRLCGSVGVVFAGCLLASGCGLSDYHDRMADEQARLDYFDEEARLLDVPIEVPRHQDDEDFPPVEVFLRLPKGVVRVSDDVPLVAPFVRYLHDQRVKSDCAFEAVYLYVTRRAAAEFRNEVLRAFPGINFDTATEYVKRPVGRKPISYKRLAGQGAQSNCTVFIHFSQRVAPPIHIAIAYALGPGRTEQHGQLAQDFSLASLLVGQEGTETRRHYQEKAPAGQDALKDLLVPGKAARP